MPASFAISAGDFQSGMMRRAKGTGVQRKKGQDRAVRKGKTW